MKSYYRLLVEHLRDKAPDYAKHANIEDVEIINQVVSELATDPAQELCDGIREL